MGMGGIRQGLLAQWHEQRALFQLSARHVDQVAQQFAALSGPNG